MQLGMNARRRQRTDTAIILNLSQIAYTQHWPLALLSPTAPAAVISCRECVHECAYECVCECASHIHCECQVFVVAVACQDALLAAQASDAYVLPRTLSSIYV